MGDAGRHLLQSFEALSETERREVLEELLRRAADLPYSFPSDDELVQAAVQVFEDLDRREAAQCKRRFAARFTSLILDWLRRSVRDSFLACLWKNPTGLWLQLFLIPQRFVSRGSRSSFPSDFYARAHLTSRPSLPSPQFA